VAVWSLVRHFEEALAKQGPRLQDPNWYKVDLGPGWQVWSVMLDEQMRAKKIGGLLDIVATNRGVIDSVLTHKI
jgi:hypothetical protein